MTTSYNFEKLMKLDVAGMANLCGNIETHQKNSEEAKKLTQVLLSLRKRKEKSTFVLSLFIKKGDLVNNYITMLADEYGTASNIKMRENRLPVLGAITRVQHYLREQIIIDKEGKSHYNVIINCSINNNMDYMIAYTVKTLDVSLYLMDNTIHTPYDGEPMIEKLIENSIDSIYCFELLFY